LLSILACLRTREVSCRCNRAAVLPDSASEDRLTAKWLAIAAAIWLGALTFAALAVAIGYYRFAQSSPRPPARSPPAQQSHHQARVSSIAAHDQHRKSGAANVPSAPRGLHDRADELVLRGWGRRARSQAAAIGIPCPGMIAVACTATVRGRVEASPDTPE
jgi:hypothetical protein